MPEYENQLYDEARNNFIRTFNNDPKKAIEEFYGCKEEDLHPVEMLEESLEGGLPQNFDRDQQLAILFHEKNGELNPKLLGEYLCQDNDNSKNTLKYFTEMMNFERKSIVEGLREYFTKISVSDKIPEIRKIAEAYGNEYYSQNESSIKHTKDIANQDAAVKLTSQIILTNRDKEKQPNKFMNDLKGANGGGHFLPSYLQIIYRDINNKDQTLEAKRVDVPTQYRLSIVDKKPFDKLPQYLKQDVLEGNMLGTHRKVRLTKTLDNDQQIAVIVDVSYKNTFIGNSCDIIVQPVAAEGKTPSKEVLDLAAGIVCQIGQNDGKPEISAPYVYLKKDLKASYDILNPPKQNVHDKDNAANIDEKLKKEAALLPLLHKGISKNTQAGKSKIAKLKGQNYPREEKLHIKYPDF